MEQHFRVKLLDSSAWLFIYIQIDITETRLWTHPVNENMLSAEGILLYRNMQVLADMQRQTQRTLERLIALFENASKL